MVAVESAVAAAICAAMVKSPALVLRDRGKTGGSCAVKDDGPDEVLGVDVVVVVVMVVVTTVRVGTGDVSLEDGTSADLVEVSGCDEFLRVE